MKLNINIIIKDDNLERIDKYLSDYFDISRAMVTRNIKNENIKVNGEGVKPSYKLLRGDSIQGHIEDESIILIPEDIDLDIVYEDDYIIIVNKPHDLVVHPSMSNKSGTLVNSLLNYTENLSDLGGDDRPGIVHRLDKDTTGLLIVAKDNVTHEKLKNMFKNRDIVKKYLAIVHGRPNPMKGLIDKPIGRSMTNRTKMEVTNLNSRPALTEYNTIDYNEEYSLLDISLHTGRTHQIRVHLKYIGHPIVGDKVYGFKKEKINTVHHLLHAYYLEFIHPMTEEKLIFKIDPGVYFKSSLEKLNLRYINGNKNIC